MEVLGTRARDPGRVAPHNTSARSRACWMVGFAIPMPEGSNPEGKDWTRGQQRGCWPPQKLADTWWSGLGSLASDAKQGCPDIDAGLVCRRRVGASCRDHEKVRPWRSNALHSAPR